MIGGGPAGSAVAGRSARLGRRALVLERRSFPRFHIGESLLPASNHVFRELGVAERLAAEGFVPKRGASFSSEDGEIASYVDFTACPAVAAPVTMQVLRSRFDEILLEHAEEAGAEVCQGCRAQDVAFEPGGVKVTVAGADGRNREVTAEVVVDASGQAGFLAKRLDLRRLDPKLRNVALYAHYEGVPRPEGERSGDIRIVSRRDMSWFWLIPLPEGVTSVGVVVSKERHAARPREAPEKILDDLVASTPAVASQMGSAKRVSKARYEADFCYAARAYAGDRWLLTGDAGSFLDPVFSTGVQVALESGLEAADAIDRALETGDVSARAFADFQRLQKRRYKYFRRLAHGFYDPAFRDLLLTPSSRIGLVDATVSALAGEWRPSPALRLKLNVFFALVALQRYVSLAPRSHAR